MLDLVFTAQFKKDFKLSKRKGCQIKRLMDIVVQLQAGSKLSAKYQDHALLDSKNFKGVRECHITPDWLLVYKIDEDRLKLIRMGSHSDLF